METGSPSGARVASARTDERDSCEVAMKHFSEDDGWGWPVKGMAARIKKPVNLLLLRWGHLRLLCNTKQNTPSTLHHPPRVLPSPLH